MQPAVEVLTAPVVAIQTAPHLARPSAKRALPRKLLLRWQWAHYGPDGEPLR